MGPRPPQKNRPGVDSMTMEPMGPRPPQKPPTGQSISEFREPVGPRRLREGPVGTHNGPTATPPMQGPPAPQKKLVQSPKDLTINDEFSNVRLPYQMPKEYRIPTMSHNYLIQEELMQKQIEDEKQRLIDQKAMAERLRAAGYPGI